MTGNGVKLATLPIILYFFPTYSYEQYYQSIRSVFGDLDRRNDVTIDMVISDGQESVLESLNRLKHKKQESCTRKLSKDNVNNSFYLRLVKEFNKEIITT